MLKKHEEKIKKILENADAYIVASDKGDLMYGEEGSILSIYTFLTKSMFEVSDGHLVKKAFRMGLDMYKKEK